MKEVELILLESVSVMRWDKDLTSLSYALTTTEAIGAVQEILKGLYLNGYEINKTEDLRKNKRDLINWFQSELANETKSKLGKTMNSYRGEKIKFLNKILRKLNQ